MLSLIKEKGNEMKRVIGILLALFLVLSLGACGDSNQPVETEAPDLVADDAVEEPEYVDEEEEEAEEVPIPDSLLVRALTSDEMRAFEAEHAVTAEQERYLAFGAFVPTNNQESIRVFAMGESGNHAVRILANSWSVTDQESALVQLENLSGGRGQSPVADDIFHTLVLNGRFEPLDAIELFMTGFDFAGLEHVYRSAVSRAERMEDEFELLFAMVGAPEEDREEVFELFVFMQFADRINRGLEAYQGAMALLMESFGFTEEELLSIPTLAAWDYGRTAIIARYGYAAGYVEEDVAWAHLKIAADSAAQTYSSWREFTAAYILGRALAFGNPSADTRDTLDFLLNHPESAFQNIAFRVA